MNKRGVIIVFTTIIIVAGIIFYFFFPRKAFQAEDFHIEREYSLIDYDKDGIDDYTDILLGARKDAENHPRYDGSYVSGGYPSDNVGVCADVIWRAFKEAGYNLKDMIDEDIKNHKDDYPGLGGKADPNIDFRRVRNLKAFFDKYAESLTLDLEEIAQWQPGDIVVFGKKYTHIGIISDKRNKKGIPYLIHNAGQYKREEDALEKWNKKSKIVGHYRWNGGYYDSIR